MQTTLISPCCGRPDLDTNPAFNVVIAYEDFETGKHAKRTFDYLAEHLGEECQFANQMWKFDVLAVPKLREMAAKDAAAADIIIVSAHGSNELPSEVEAWVELWLSDRRNTLALVALFDAEEWIDNPVRFYLSKIARRAGIEFFSQPGQWPGRERDTDGTLRSLEAGSKTLSVLAGAAQQREGFSHWGINE